LIIESKFHDYYDCIQSLGIDKTTVFKRHTKELPVNSLKDEVCNLYLGNLSYSQTFPIKQFIILFCGKSYAGFEITDRDFSWDPYTTKYTYSVKDVKEYYPDKQQGSRRYRSYRSFDRIEEWHNKYNDKPYNVEIFRNHDTPILFFKEHSNIVIKNPTLKDYRFQTILDPFTAYQEINQFISGVLGQPEKETIQVDEKTKVQSKGFDKWSFRKQSHQRKGKQND